MGNGVTIGPEILRDKREISFQQYKNLSLELRMVQLKSTKLSQIAVHLLYLFFLPSVHQHTNF